MRHLIRLCETPREPHNIEGLPDEIEVKDDTLKKTIARGGHRAIAKPGISPKYATRQNYDVQLHPIGHGVPYKMRPNDPRDRIGYYDPELADLETIDPDEPFARIYARLKPQFSDTIKPLPGDGIIYRGMSAEEFANFKQTGEIVSHGNYNIGDAQRGLTYWTTDPASAAHYANGFAPLEHKASFLHPAYVVAAKRPKETRRVPGVGEHEIGVERPITAAEVVAVWQGRVYDYNPGDIQLRPVTDTEYRQGSASMPGGHVAWQRLEIRQR